MTSIFIGSWQFDVETIVKPSMKFDQASGSHTTYNLQFKVAAETNALFVDFQVCKSLPREPTDYKNSNPAGWNKSFMPFQEYTSYQYNRSGWHWIFQ